MSTFICRMAMNDVNTTAITATRIVTGRRMAVNTNHMRCLPRGPAEAGPDVLFGRARLDPVEARPPVAARLLLRQQRTPQAAARGRLVRSRPPPQPPRAASSADGGRDVLTPRPARVPRRWTAA